MNFSVNSSSLLGRLCFACLVLLLVVTERANGALSPLNNIDTREPVVRISPAVSDQLSDMFGWAAVLHQISAPQSTDSLSEAVARSRIIVGAPRGTFPGGLLSLVDLGSPAEVQTGLVYNCPVAPGECGGVRGDSSIYINDQASYENNASIGSSQITIDNLPQSFVEGRLFDQAPNVVLYSFGDMEYRINENKTGQLLGATLYSSGDKFIACAPRWTDNLRVLTTALPRGLCYASGRNLQGFQRLQPCTGNTGSLDDTRGNGYCIAGKSAIPYDDFYIIGAPLNDVRGSLYFSTSAAPATFAQGNLYQPGSNGAEDQTITDQYQGFVTISAYITQARSASLPPNVVTTVPRYTDDTYTGRIDVYNPPNFAAFSDLIQTVDAQGSQMAEFFGHSMIAIDINGDDYDDLVIGAPMNTDYTANNLLIERGRIYVFINDGAGTFPNTATNRLVINGTIARGRFGTSLTNLGDINYDNYEDFAVGAPYTPGADGNTGTVYVYYGSSNPEINLLSQEPFEIKAEDIVSSVNGLDIIKSFGWSLSSGVDVDNNQYNDLVIGAYESRSVVMLRTLPVATVTIAILPVSQVEFTSNFAVTVRAYYTGVGVTGQISVPFTLSEVLDSTLNRRLTFANSGRGTFVMSGPGLAMSNDQMVMVIPLTNVTSLDDYVLRLELGDIVRVIGVNVDGNQAISDLSPFPRLIQQGNDTASVSIMNPCGTDGCVSDVRLRPPPANITVTAGGDTHHSIDLFYEHISGDDAVGLNLTLSNLRSDVIIGVVIIRNGSTASETPCSSISAGNATCTLQPRLMKGNNGTVVLNFTVDQTSLRGDEENFTVNVEVISMTDDSRDMDSDTTNNNQPITFNVVAMADISVTELSFGGTTFTYSGVTPSLPILSATSLGQSVSLVVTVMNSGPSTIRTGRLDINFPFRFMDNQFPLLYPTQISSTNDAVQCEMGFIDPEGLGTSSAQIGETRRRRSAAAAAARSRRSDLTRVPRQSNGKQTVDCAGSDADTSSCTMIACNVSNFAQGSLSVSIFARIDDRFFATQIDQRTEFNLIASASVSVNENFYGDNTDNNIQQVSIMLLPMAAAEEGTDRTALILAIVFPCIGGIILLILLALLLYCLGCFRRKRKPDGDEAEGDFDVDKYKLDTKAPATDPSAPLTDETSKV